MSKSTDTVWHINNLGEVFENDAWVWDETVTDLPIAAFVRDVWKLQERHEKRSSSFTLHGRANLKRDPGTEVYFERWFIHDNNDDKYWRRVWDFVRDTAGVVAEEQQHMKDRKRERHVWARWFRAWPVSAAALTKLHSRITDELVRRELTG